MPLLAHSAQHACAQGGFVSESSLHYYRTFQAASILKAEKTLVKKEGQTFSKLGWHQMFVLLLWQGRNHGHFSACTFLSDRASYPVSAGV